MSERMNKERAIELLKAIKEEDDIKYCNYQERYYKALDIAIECIANAEIDNKIIKMQHDRIQELEQVIEKYKGELDL